MKFSSAIKPLILVFVFAAHSLSANAKPVEKLSFLEQRNINLLEASNIRSDWYPYIKGLIDSNADLTAPAQAEPKLFRLYLMYLAAQYEAEQEQLDDNLFVMEVEIEKQKLAQREKDAESLVGGKHSAIPKHLIEASKKLYLSAERENENLRAAVRAAKAQVEQVLPKLMQMPLDVNEVFLRPHGAPLISRSGHFYSFEEWKKFEEAEEPFAKIKNFCRRLLGGK